MAEALHPGLSLRGVTRDFGGRGIAGVDLDVRPGRVTAVLGPNGAGKSTLLRAAAGRLRLDRGEVRVAGGDPLTDAAARRHIGFVPQEPALFPHLSLRENLEVFGGLAGLGSRRAAARAGELLARVGLQAEEDRRAAVLSGGQRKRASLAAGVVHAPTVALLDEPTAGVDAAARGHVHALVRAMRAEGAAVLLSTHDVEDAEELADVVAVMAAGAVQAEGPPAELVARTFAGERELTVALVSDPGEEQARALVRLGFAPTSRPRRFVGVARDAAASAAVLEALLREGLRVEEARLREPSLRGVLLRLTGRETGE